MGVGVGVGDPASVGVSNPRDMGMGELVVSSLTVFRSLPGDPARDLAFEEEMLARASDGTPGLFLYSWPQPTLVLGHGQPKDDVDLESCRRAGVSVVRRVTGGTGVLHHDDLAVSLALPSVHPWAREIGDLYDRFLAVIRSALERVGVPTERATAPFPSRRSRSPICFEDAARETLLVSGRKAVGCAQARRRRSVLVHASLLLNLDPGLYAAVFGVPAERIAASLAPLPVPDRPSLVAALVAGFSSAPGIGAREVRSPGSL